jgi:ketosteroid isomerase-like protein
MKKTVTILMLTFAVVAPAFAADDAKTIAQRLNNDWIEAFTKNNAAGLTSLYTKDAVLAPPGSAQPIIGADNIRKFFDEMLKAKLTNIAIPITEANMLDSKSLYQVGPWTAEAGRRLGMEVPRRRVEHAASSAAGHGRCTDDELRFVDAEQVEGDRRRSAAEHDRPICWCLSTGAAKDVAARYIKIPCS